MIIEKFLTLDFRFHAKWCKTCQKIKAPYRQLAELEVEKHSFVSLDAPNVAFKGRARFADVEYGPETKLWLSELGVNALPYIHMYNAKDGQLCEFACPRNKFRFLKEKIEEFA